MVSVENKNYLKSSAKRDNPIDYFFSNLLAENLKKEIGLSEYRKIKKRFQSKFKLTILSAFADFYKIDGILREIFGRKTDKIEQEIIQKCLSKIKRGNDVWIVTEDNSISSIFLESYGDAFKKTILDPRPRRETGCTWRRYSTAPSRRCWDLIPAPRRSRLGWPASNPPHRPPSPSPIQPRWRSAAVGSQSVPLESASAAIQSASSPA